MNKKKICHLDRIAFDVCLAKAQLNQSDLAKKVGISAARLSQYRSLCSIPEEVAKHVAEVLKINVNSIFTPIE